MEEKAKKLSTEPYKGVRDFYPEEMFVQNYIFGIWKKTVESFGYTEYSASLLEPAELYRAKSSAEIVSEQTYTFLDRGEREVTLRPEMTPTVARMVAAKRRELPSVLRWYSIPNVFRYERPQRGRLREHWQLNADLFGVEGIEADSEILHLVSAIMLAFGAKSKDFEIRIASRKILNKKIAELNLNSEKTKELMQLLDKKDKISDFGAKLASLIGVSEWSIEADEEIAILLEAVKKRGVNNVVFDPGIIRGFEYYTGIVFEVYDTSTENKRALFGGGRYDNLLDIFGESTMPAVGFGMGDVTMRDFLETHNLLPKYQPATHLYIAKLDAKFTDHTEALGDMLRKEGLNVAIDYSGKKVGDQLKCASKLGIPFVIVIGEDEIKSKKYKVKEMETGKETVLEEKEIAKHIIR